VGETSSVSLLRHYVGVFRRRKWVIVLAVLAAPITALAVALQQQPRYSASSEVLLSEQNLAQGLAGLPAVSQLPDRIATTQAGLARLPAVADRVLRAVPSSGMTLSEFLSSSSVTTQSNSDLLEFSVRASDPTVSVRLARAYAEQYTLYWRSLNTQALHAARGQIDRQIHELGAAGRSPAALLATLEEHKQQLQTLEALAAANAVVVRSPESAHRVSPRPVRAGALALGLGIVLGIGCVLLLEEFDPRIRSVETITDRVGLPLLGRIPKPPRPVTGPQDLVTLEGGPASDTEPLRMLQAKLQLVIESSPVRTIAVTSALDREGKSTTVAKLAIAFARAGGRVALCDLDGRKPVLDRFFGLVGRPGLVDVVDGSVSLERTLAPIKVDLGNQSEPSGLDGSPLLVLPFGRPLQDGAEFVVSGGVSDVLAAVSARVQLVLIDAPPILQSADAFALTTHVDGVLVIVNAKLARRDVLDELARVLETIPAKKLGLVVTGVSKDDVYGYAYAHLGEEIQRPLQDNQTPSQIGAAAPLAGGGRLAEVRAVPDDGSRI
jgi:tyrosine-protein kinase